MDLKEAFTRKIGPLPAYAYGLIVLIVVWGIYYARQLSGNGNTASTTDVGSAPSDSDIGSLDDSGYVSSNPSSGASTVVPSSNKPTDNQNWYMLASDYLIGFGYSGSAVTDALTKYLTGQELTAADRALVNQAIAKFGAPPEGVPVTSGAGNNPPPLPGDGGNNNPPPSEQHDDTPPVQTSRTYVIKSGDTLSRIAMLYYGSSSKWPTIYNANASTIEAAAKAHGKASSKGPDGSVGWWIWPGTTLVIP